MKELGILLLVAIIAMGILLIILLQKITILKKQTDDIVKEVKTYITYVLEEPEEKSLKPEDRASREDAQNKLIQAVLGEYFP